MSPEFLNVRILEKFLVETSVEVVDRGDPNFDFYSDENSRWPFYLIWAMKVKVAEEVGRVKLSYEISSTKTK